MSLDVAAPLSVPGLSKTLSLPMAVPPIAETSGIGPRRAGLRRRARLVYVLMLVIGALPTLLPWLGMMRANAPLQALGWGLWLPGAGFVANGGWATLLFPITLALFTVGMLGWAFAGMLALPILVWVGSAIAAWTLSGPEVTAYSPIAVPVLTFGVIIQRWWKEGRVFRAQSELGRRRAGYLKEAVAAVEAAAVLHVEPRRRELTRDELKSAQYVFDLALQPIGEFKGFTHRDNFQLAALRYQLNHISYALALLQCKYTPNFHGYLNRAQQYAIESLTLPRVCGYWKWEALWGQFRWNPDPVGTRDNVMLTGWSLIALSTYAANTGDLRYQQPGALRFRPFRGRETAYAHDAHSFVRSLAFNWSRSPFYLYPCEPTLSFSVCNTLAFCGVVPYDRLNRTGIAADVHRRFLEAVETEFLLPDGTPHVILNTLTGASSAGIPGPGFALSAMLAMSRLANPLHPGYAKRWFALARHEFLRLDGDNLVLQGVDWLDGFDIGNYKKLPGYMLADIAQAAREHGDNDLAEAALRKADELLRRVADPEVLAYEDISAGANINLAIARWSRRDDWHDLINVGPDPGALQGPILADCEYPAVLVARAFSDGSDLDLVLYNGAAAGPRTLRIERLTPVTRYAVEGATISQVVADADGAASLTVYLDGRTAVRLVPEARNIFTNELPARIR
jgi:hypothetical protein